MPVKLRGAFERNVGLIWGDAFHLRNRMIIRFGRLGGIKEAIAEGHFEHEKQGEKEFVVSLLGAGKEDILRFYQESKRNPRPLLY